MRSIRTLRLSLRLGALARATVLVMAWHVARVGVQVAWLLLAVRALGAGGYGAFAGVSGLAIVLGGFVSWGLGLRMYQDSAREKTVFPARWSQALRAWWISALVLCLLFTVVGSLTFEDYAIGAIIAIGIAELVFAPLAALIAFGFSAQGNVVAGAMVPALSALSRLASIVLFQMLAAPGDLGTYAVFHLSGVAIGSTFIFFAFARNWSAGVSAPLGLSEFRIGSWFSATWAGTVSWGALDKAIVLNEGGEHVAGVFSAAHRVISVASLPVDALIGAALPRMFQRGAGHEVHPHLMAAMTVATICYGLGAGGLTLLLAGWIVSWLGPQFSEALAVLQLLALCIPIACVRVLLAHWLLTTNDVKWRVLLELLAQLAMVIAMVILVPRYGALGAGMGWLIAESALALFYVLRLVTRSRSKKRMHQVSSRT